jgi:DNA-binding transcriptional LysR family regulator
MTPVRHAYQRAGSAVSGVPSSASPHLASGVLVRVLEDWCPPFPGYFLYHPSRRQQPAALAALIETLRVVSLEA